MSEKKKSSNKKKIANTLLVAPVVVSSMPMDAFINEAEAAGEIVIRTVQDLQNMKNNPSGSYILANDLDLSGFNYVPFDFSGTLDGAGYKIKNLNVDRAANYNGLFSKINSANIKNLTFENANVGNEQYSYQGVLAGYANNSTVTNVHSINGTVKALNFAGGLIGVDNYHSDIIQSSTSGTVAGTDLMGGLVGKLGEYGTIVDSYSHADVTGRDFVGGILGQTTGYNTLSKLISTGSIEGNNHVAGIAGQLNEDPYQINHGWPRYWVTYYKDVTVRNVFALNKSIKNSNDQYNSNQGKIYGSNTGNGVDVANAYISDKTQGDARLYKVTGVVKEDEMNLPEKYAGLDFTNVWAIDEATGIPYLKSQNSNPYEKPVYSETPTAFVKDGKFYTAIYNINDLHNIVRLSENHYNYMLMNDLDFAEVPNFNNLPDYRGEFEGQNHKILNLTVNKASANNGFFQTLTNAKVLNLTFVDPDIQSNYNNTGTLAGTISGATINNVHVINGNLVGKGSYSGLISGSISNSDVDQVSTSGKVNAMDYSGGIFGQASNTTMNDSYSVADVIGRNYVGGLTGFSTNSDFTDMYATGKIEGNDYVAGAIGQTSGTSNDIKNLYAFNPSVVKYANTGYIYGKAIGSDALNIGNIDNLVIPTTMSMQGHDYGVTKTVEPSAVYEQETYAFDFETKWKMDSEVNLPTLQTEERNTGVKPTYGEKVTVVEKDGVFYTPIYDKEDFLKIEQALSGKYILMNDIDFEGQEIVPLNEFRGTLEGQNFKMKNVNVKDTNNYSGLFTNILNATVQNVTLENLAVQSTGHYVGGLAGKAANSKIDNVHIEGSITGANYTGSLLGVSDTKTTTSNVSTAGTVNGADSVGGIIGDLAGESTLSNSFSTVETVQGKNSVGGVVGSAHNGISISDVYSTSKVDGTDYVGGVIGQLYRWSYNSGTTGFSSHDIFDLKSSVKNIYALNPTVTSARSKDYHGQVIGGIRDYSGDIKNAFTKENVVGLEEMEGFAHVHEMTDLLAVNELNQTTSYGFDFENTWHMDPATGLPILNVLEESPSSKPEYGTVKTTVEKDGVFYNAVYNREDLKDIEFAPTSNILIMNDIDLENNKFDPIDYFSGKLEGQSHILRNLNIEHAGVNDTGLIENIYKASIKDLNILDSTVTSDSDFVGILGGKATSSTIENIHTTGSVKGRNYTGHVIGHAYNTVNMQKISASGSVEGNDQTGGLFGQIDGTVKVTNALSAVNVKGNNQTGGLVGYLRDDSVLTDVYTTGTIEGRDYVGGAVGKTDDSNNRGNQLNNVYVLNPSVTTSLVTDYFGKTVGYGGGLATSNLVVAEEMDSLGHSHYITGVLDTEHLNEEESYKFDFTNDWKMDNEAGLPVLQILERHPSVKPEYKTINTTVMKDDVAYNALYNTQDVANAKYALTSKFLVMNDMDFKDVAWEPIMNFRGVFDGSNHDFTNLSVSGASQIGLFGTTNQGANIYDLDILNANIAATGNSAGILAGTMAGTKVQNVQVTGTVSGVDQVGSLAGYIGNKSDVDRISSAGDVQGKNYTGGAIGYVANDTTINDAYSASKVTGNQYVGGLAGAIHNNVDIYDVYATGAIEGAISIGGLVGHSSHTGNSLIDAYALNEKMTATQKSESFGKAIGSWSHAISQSNVVAEEINSLGHTNYVTETVKTEELNDPSIYAFNFETTWKMDDEAGLPIFQTQVSYPSSSVQYDKKDTTVVKDGVVYTAIYDETDLKNIEFAPTGKYLLMNDIDLAGKDFTSIDYLKGVFDGNGHKILNFSVNNESTDENTGFFKTIHDGAVVRDLDIVNANVSSKGSFTGILAGTAYTNVTIDNVHVDGSVEGANYVGSLFGRTNKNVKLTKISTQGTVKGENYSAGIVGRAESGTYLYDVYSQTNVEGNRYVGGLVGEGYYDVDILRAFATGTVKGNDFIGGIIGRYDSSLNQMQDVYALNSSVVSTATEPVTTFGKVIGGWNANITSSNVQVAQNMESKGHVLKIDNVVETEKIKDSVTYKNFDFVDVWEIDSDTELPKIKTHTNPLQAVQYKDVKTSVVKDNVVYNAIYTPEELQDMKFATNSKFLLQNDIDMEGVNYIPIKTFAGILDGDHHKIDNLSVEQTSENTGLFAEIRNGQVLNLNIVNAEMTSDTGMTGILAGNIYQATVDNVHVDGKVTSNANVGSLAGQVDYNSTINRVSTDGTVKGKNNAGGITGLLNQNSKITNSYSGTDVTGDTYVGGLVGQMANRSILEDVYTNGSILGNDHIGGLIGFSNGVNTLYDAYALNDEVKANDITNNIGKAIGSTNSTITKRNIRIVENMESEGHYQFIDNIVSLDGLKEPLSYAYDFTNIWEVKPEVGIPTLRTQAVNTIEVPQYNEKITTIIRDGKFFTPVYDVWNFDKIRYNPSGNFVLMNDLDFTDEQIQMLPAFSGTLAGDGYTIRNLTINGTGDQTGLFTRIDNAKVENLNIDDFIVSSSGNYVGTLAGQATNSTITNVHVDSKVKGRDEVGSIVGRATSSTIQRTSTAGTVEGKTYVGGTAGFLYNGSAINDSYATADVTGTSNVGGIAGELNTRATLKNVYAANNVTGQDLVGGITGELDQTGNSLSNVFALNPAVKGTGLNGNLGKVIGLAKTGYSKTNINLLDVMDSEGHAIDVNTIITKEQAQVQSTYPFDYENIWSFDNEKGFPVLKGQDGYPNVVPEYKDVTTTKITDGTIFNIIHNAEDLQDMQYAPRANYSLDVDIDLKDINFTPIPSFNGELAGNGHKISNLNLNTEMSLTGLFATTNGANIHDLSLENANITTTRDRAGALVANAKDTDITNVIVRGTVNGKSSTGLVVGYAESGTVLTKVDAVGEVTGDNAVGGIVGNLVNSKIIDSLSVGQTEGSTNVGGIAGELNGSEISKVYTKNKVNASTSAAGGIAGKTQGTGNKVTNSFALNFEVVSYDHTTSGLVVGSKIGDLTATNVKAHENVNGNASESNISGFVKDEQLAQQSTFVGWDFNSVWKLTNSEIPYLNQPVDKEFSELRRTEFQKITLRWFPIDGAINYTIKRNGVVIGTTEDTAFTDDDAIVGRRYRYEIIPNSTSGAMTSEAIALGEIEVLPYQLPRFTDPEYFPDGNVYIGNDLAIKNDPVSIGERVQDYMNMPAYITRLGSVDDGYYPRIEFRGIEGTSKYRITRNGEVVTFIYPKFNKYGYQESYQVVPVVEGVEDLENSYNVSVNSRNDDFLAVSLNIDGIDIYRDNYGIEALDSQDQVIGEPIELDRRDILDNTVTTGPEDETVAIEWYRVPGATKYQVYRDGELVTSIPESGLSYYSFQDENVEPNTRYHYEVVPVDKEGENMPGKYEILGMALLPYTPSLNIDIQEVEGTGKASATLTWPEQEDAMLYRVDVFEADSSGDFVVSTHSVTTTNPSMVVPDLKSDTEYKFVVTPRFNYVDDYSKQLIAYDTTPHMEEPVKEEVVVDLKAKNLTVIAEGNTVTASWEAPNEEVSKYRVSLEVLDKETNVYKTVGVPQTVSGTTANFTNLPQGNQYKVTVTPFDGMIYNTNHAVNKEVELPVVEAPEEVIPAVSNIVATVASTTSASVNWESFALNGKEATKYRIQTYVKEDGEFVKSGFARTTSSTNFVVTGLKEGNEYHFEVIPMVNNSYSTKNAGISNDITLSTKPVEPTIPESTNVENVVATLEGNKADIKWDAFVSGGKEVTQYRIQKYIKDPVTGNFLKDGTPTTAYEPSTSLTDLKEGKEYYFEILPLVSGQYLQSAIGTSNTVQVAAAENNDQETTVNKVVNVNANVENKLTTVTWDQFLVNGVPATKYRVQPFAKNKETGVFEPKGFATTANTNSLTYSNLELDLEYYFQVTPLAGGKYDAQLAGTSNTIYLDPSQFVVKAEPVPNLHVIMEGNLATVHWQPITVNGEEITRYRVQRYVLDETTGKYKVDLYAPAITGTSYVDTYNKTGAMYRYEVTPLSNNEGRYLFEHTTTIYFVKLQEEGQARVFFGTDPNVDPTVTTDKEITVQRYVLDTETNEFVIDGEPFIVDRYDFDDNEAAEGKQYRYEFVTETP